jgi:ribosomal protein S18 acetylase RimI-like enzyme
VDNVSIHVITQESIQNYEQQTLAFASQWREEFWPGEEVVKTLRQGAAILLVALNEQSQWRGVMLLQIMPPLSDLLYIYVAGSGRGLGVGKRLITEGMALLRGKGVERLLLEVKPSNREAIGLYEQFGFTLTGRRPRYYQSGDDALIYEVKILNEVMSR